MDKLIDKRIEKLKKNILKSIRHNQLNKAIGGLSICSRLLYEYNQSYTDEQLEDDLLRIASQLPQSVQSQLIADTVLFYDGFGNDVRGLALIYLRALSKSNRRIVYVTYDTVIDKQPLLHKELEGCNIIWVYIPMRKKYTTQCDLLIKVFHEYCPQNAFIYTTPEDVVGLSVFMRQDKVTRYQINLTDHAYWLGIHAFDYCIEFRDYGASISKYYRNIPQSKLVKLPFYPIVNKDKGFEGYPFKFNEKIDKFIFSGGSLYKTLGGDNNYYKILEYILQLREDVIIWYAGDGDTTEIDKLISKYPNRIIRTEERRDLFQILQHSYFYLSTYPLCGGLMFQYAAVANCIPVTLKYDEVSDGFLLEQRKLGVEFDSIEGIKQEIKRLFEDRKYKEKKAKSLSNAVICEDDFTSNVELLLQNHTTKYDINTTFIDTAHFRQQYLQRYSQSQMNDLFQYRISCRRNIGLFMNYPVSFLIGAWKKIFS